MFSFKTNCDCSFLTFHIEQPETMIEQKFESMTYLRTDLYLTWVGARDTCMSKNCNRGVLSCVDLNILEYSFDASVCRMF